MVETKEQIISDFKDYIAKNSSASYSDWYVGIASKPEERLFTDHNVKKVGDYWIYSEAQSTSIAREIEQYFIEQFKTDGGTGGGDNTTKWVYAYRMTSTTEE